MLCKTKKKKEENLMNVPLVHTSKKRFCFLDYYHRIISHVFPPFTVHIPRLNKKISKK